MMNHAPWPVQEMGLGSINPANTGDIIHSSSSSCSSKPMLERKARPSLKERPLSCPRCSSTNTKFCYYNNYSASQPRHFCKNCKRYWTEGGSLRNVPVGGSSRKNKKQIPKKMTDSAATNSLDSSILTHTGDVGKESHFENFEDVLENHAAGLPFDLLRSGDLSKCHNSSLSSLNLLRNGSSCSVSNLSSFLPTNNQYSDAELGFNGVSAAALNGFGNFQGVSEETGRLGFGLQGLRHESVLGFEESAGNHGEPFGYWSDVLGGAFCWNHNTTNYGP